MDCRWKLAPWIESVLPEEVSIVTAIAVVGIGCRLPGYVDSPDALWGALLAGIDFVTDIPQQRWNADDYYEPVAGAPGRSGQRSSRPSGQCQSLLRRVTRSSN